MSLVAVPLTRDEANEFIVAKHRHHGRVTSHRFIVGAEQAGELVGCAVVECANAPRWAGSALGEVTRLCSDGSRNVCSFLYGKCSRLALEWGFHRLFTYILLKDPGTSLKGCGWLLETVTKGGSRDRKARPRTDKSDTGPKQRWAPTWCAWPDEDAAEQLAAARASEAA